MPIDVPVIMLIAIAAIVVAAVAAQRAVEHAELTSGRPSDPDGRRPGPLGPFLDALDESAAAATVRSRFGTSTLTRRERRAEAERVGGDRAGGGGTSSTARQPRRRTVRSGWSWRARPPRVAVMTPARSTLSVELLAATLGLAVVVLVVVGIWPRESSGAVLSVTATPAPTVLASASPSPDPATAP